MECPFAGRGLTKRDRKGHGVGGVENVHFLGDVLNGCFPNHVHCKLVANKIIVNDRILRISCVDVLRSITTVLPTDLSSLS